MAIKSEAKLTTFEAISMIVGNSIGTGIIAVPYLATKNSMIDVIWMVGAAYIINVILHLIIAELSYNNGEVQPKSVTAEKDQTYALYNLTQEQLRRTLMPVGEYEKPQIRRIAEEAGLPVAHKSDSQDICFVPDHDYASFIENETGKTYEPGNFVDESGNILGRHKGLIHYTIGQRKGLGITAATPLFVKELRPATNEVVISTNESLFSDTCYISDINYMAQEHITPGTRSIGKVRYSHRGADCTLTPMENGMIKCVFDEPQRAMTPGQAAVFYQDGHVLCGGTIEKMMVN